MLITNCAWCKKTKVAGRWFKLPILKTFKYTHGLCKQCAKTVFSLTEEDIAAVRATRFGKRLYT